MAGVTFDAGALVAASRNDRTFWVWWKVATERGVVATIPAPVVAQVWRGARDARLAQVVSACRTVPMDLELGKRVGELCGRAGTKDVVDAVVVLVAAQRRDDVLTSDGSDLAALASHAPGVGAITTLASLRA